ncbi:TPA: hypothetical protein ACPYU1_004246 [Raoultella planticola]
MHAQLKCHRFEIHPQADYVARQLATMVLAVESRFAKDSLEAQPMH